MSEADCISLKQTVLNEMFDRVGKLEETCCVIAISAWGRPRYTSTDMDLTDLHPQDDYSHRFFIWHEWIQVSNTRFLSCSTSPN
jgi:hypothetical protein